MKPRFYSIILAVIIILGGCQAGEADTLVPDAKQFKIELTIPDDLQAGEPFLIKAALFNTEKQSREINHGVDLFRHAIHDGDGNLLSAGYLTYVPLVGFRVQLDPQIPYTFDSQRDNIQVLIEEKTLPAGDYEIITTASFRVEYDGQDYPLEVQAEPMKITVR